eukprot:scaffold160322_cov18-Tisochrysis_lutea.AAC.2
MDCTSCLWTALAAGNGAYGLHKLPMDCTSCRDWRLWTALAACTCHGLHQEKTYLCKVRYNEVLIETLQYTLQQDFISTGTQTYLYVQLQQMQILRKREGSMWGVEQW